MAIINCKIERNTSYYKVYIEYSYTQDIEKNTSKITAALKLQQLTDTWDFDTVSEVKVGFSISGEEFSKTQRINIDNKGDAGYTITLASGTKTVTHDSSGKKTITFSCNNTSSLLDCLYNGTNYGPGSITLDSTSVTLKTIPRNAKIDKITNSSGTTISSTNVDNSIKVYYTPTASSYYHKLVFYVDSSKKKTVELGKAGSTSQKSYSITPPASWMSSVSTGTLKCYLYTYSDSDYSTKIGSTATSSITINVPTTSTYMPTASLAITPTYNNNLNVYLKGISKAKFVITGKAGSGATISSYSLSGSGVSSTSATTTVTLNTSGTDLKYTATVKDSRGRSGSTSQNITVYAYSKPTLSSGRVTRCESDGTVSASGTYALGRITATIQSVSGKNSISSLKWYYRKLGATSWTAVGDIASGTDTVSTMTFATSTSYQFRFTVIDAVGTTVNSGIYTMPATGRPLNIARYNNGLSVGKLSTVTADDATKSKFECAWPASFDSTITAKGSIITGDDFGCNEAYNGSNFAMYCQWADGSNHDIIVRNSDGVSMGLGWVGNTDNPTSLDVRPTTVSIRGTTTVPRLRVTATTDADQNAQNNVALRIGDATGQHIDIDSNEIIAKDAPTAVGSLSLVGSAVGMYVNTVDTFRAGVDSTSEFIRSLPTYNRTYDGSANVYITSLGTFGRSTSSSQRYKTEIEDVSDASLDPYNVLKIPVRQFKYNEDNIPINKKADDLYIGFIAEEVEGVYPVAVEYNEDGQAEMWNIKVIVPAMLKIIQDQQKIIEQLQKDVENLRSGN